MNWTNRFIITQITHWTESNNHSDHSVNWPKTEYFFSWFYFCLLNWPPTLFVIRPEPRNKSWSWGAWGDDWCKFDSQNGKQKIVKYICFRFFTFFRMPTLTDLVPLILENLSRWWSRWIIIWKNLPLCSWLRCNELQLLLLLWPSLISHPHLHRHLFKLFV